MIEHFIMAYGGGFVFCYCVPSAEVDGTVVHS